MDHDARTRLKRNLAAATDDALVALANKGLLRRASKDLEKAAPPAVEEFADGLLIRGEGWTVTMPPDGPAEATDDTSASGVTRQILHATMYLRNVWLTSEADDPAAEESSASKCGEHQLDPAIEEAIELLAAASTAELFKWAGKTPLLEASTAFKPNAMIDDTPQLTIQFSENDVRVVLMTDRPAKTLSKLLAQFKSTAPKSEHPRWVMQAVLALKAAKGHSTEVENDPGAELTDAIREDRKRVAESTMKLLLSVAAAGIAHPSTRIMERFQTASVTADAAKFPRLSRLLNSIAEDARLQLARDATADPTRMKQRMVVAYALAEAAAREENAKRVDLFGRPRTNYTPVAHLELHGLGTYGWRTASGYEGLTTLLWDDEAKRFLTTTAARADGQDIHFSASWAYREGVGWSGGTAIGEMCRHRLNLSDAKINPEGRLSSSEQCKVTVAELSQPSDLNFGKHDIRSWNQLAEIARMSQPIGLRLPDSRAAYVVLRPTEWGERWFDELQQAFVWQLHDAEGNVVELRIPWTQMDEGSTAFFESLKVDRDQLTAVLGRLGVQAGRISVYPFTVFSHGTFKGDKLLCPQFDQDRIRSRNELLLKRLRKKFKRQETVDTRLGDDEFSSQMAEEALNLPPLIHTIYFDLERILISALESGANVLAPSAETSLKAIHDRLDALALRPLAESVGEVLKPRDKPLPAAILSAAYRLELFRQSLRLSVL